jgi:hypothetical protein
MMATTPAACPPPGSGRFHRGFSRSGPVRRGWQATEPAGTRYGRWMTESTSLARPRPAPSGLRLAELVGALSLAVDLGLGQPMEHLARSCLLACRLGEEMGLGEDERAALYYVALLGWVGCSPTAGTRRPGSATTSPTGPGPTTST